MQYKDPRIPSFAGLEGIDLRIQQLQQGMASNITWLQYSFGRCDAVLSKEDEVIPVCYIDDTSDPYDMRPFPDDAYKSYSFWDLLDGGIDYNDGFSANAFPVLSYDVACIVMIRLDQITSNAKVAKSMARQDLLDYFTRKVRMKGNFQITGIEEKDIELIFNGYDIADPLTILRDGVGGFRIDGTITFKQDC